MALINLMNDRNSMQTFNFNFSSLRVEFKNEGTCLLFSNQSLNNTVSYFNLKNDRIPIQNSIPYLTPLK